jgi:carboxypeptidase C (cathepsin A)
MPPRLVQNEASARVHDLVFVDPVGTGFSRVIENEEVGRGEGKEEDGRSQGVLRPEARLESMRVHRSVVVGQRALGITGFHRGESYAAIGSVASADAAGERRRRLNGAILISPALEITPLSPTDYDVVGWIDTLPTMTAAAVPRPPRAFAAGTALEVAGRGRAFATGEYASF